MCDSLRDFSFPRWPYEEKLKKADDGKTKHVFYCNSHTAFIFFFFFKCKRLRPHYLLKWLQCSSTNWIQTQVTRWIQISITSPDIDVKGSLWQILFLLIDGYNRPLPYTWLQVMLSLKICIKWEGVWDKCRRRGEWDTEELSMSLIQLFSSDFSQTCRGRHTEEVCFHQDR